MKRIAAAAGNAGIGGQARFACGIRAGKFRVEAEAQLVFGLGAHGKVQGTVDGNTIADFVAFTYHQLRAVDYEKLVDNVAGTVGARSTASH